MSLSLPALFLHFPRTTHTLPLATPDEFSGRYPHLQIYDKNNQEIGMLKQRLFTFLPKYEIYINNRLLGEIHKEFTFFKPKFNITFNNYTVDGDFFDWDYDVYRDGIKVSSINKEIFKLTDTYTITTSEEEALISLMIVLAIDSIKDQRNNNN